MIVLALLNTILKQKAVKHAFTSYLLSNMFIIICSLFVNNVLSIPRSPDDEEKIPKLILISMDGFRFNYLEKIPIDRTPNFHYFLKHGVQAKWIRNVFPSSTFPNHMSILTGLFPESHGVVDNRFYDPFLNETFDMSNMEQNFESQWFDAGAEPIWVTNHKKGGKRYSGSVMWPDGVAPVKCVKLDRLIRNMFWGNESFDYKLRIDKLISWFTDEKRPINLGLLYFPEPDETGHHNGTDSPILIQMIEKLDDDLGYLRKKLEDYNLDDVNIIITADHGMTMFENKTINLDEILDPDLYSLWTGKLSYIAPQILPNPGAEDKVFNKLDNYSNFYVYKKGSPELKALHYSDNNRIAPIVLEARKGWIFINNDTIKHINTSKKIKGIHGYDPRKIPEMHPFFIASGPAFRKGVIVEPFDMVDIYPLMCHLLGLTPAPNNGSLENVKNLLINPPESSRNFQTTAATYFVVFILAALVAGLFSIGVIRQSKSSQLRHGIHQIRGIPQPEEDKQYNALLHESDEDEF